MSILSFLHSIAFLVYSYLAFFVFAKNSTATLNRVCSALLFCLGIWSFGFIFLHAPGQPKHIAELYFKISSFGWLTLPSLALWFMLVFAEENTMLKSNLLYLALFLPPVIGIIILWSGLVPITYTRFPYGWLTSTQINLWPVIRYIIYLLFMILTIVYNFRVYQTLRNIQKKRQALLLLFSLLITISVTIIAKLISLYYDQTVPDISNLYSLIWTSGLIFLLSKYNFMAINPTSATTNIISMIPDSLIMLDHKHNIVYLNNQALKLLNYSSTELTGSSVSIIFGNEIEKATITHKISNAEMINNTELLLVSKTGIQVPVLFSSSVLYNQSGTIRGTVCIATDITDYKNKEAMLRIKDSALATSINAIALADLNGDINYVNRSLVTMWHYDTENEILKKPLSSLWLASGSSNKIITKLKKEGTWLGEVIALSKQEHEFYVQLSASIVTDIMDKPLCIMASFVDITDRKKIEAAMRKREEKYRTFFNSINELVITVDEAGVILFANKQITNFTGMEREDTIGLNLIDFAHPDDSWLVTESINKALICDIDPNRDIMTHGMEFRMIRADNEMLWVSVRLHPYLDYQNTVLGFTGIVRDITKRKETDEKIATALDEKELLLKEIHHRVKNNMQVICSLLNLQSRYITDDATRDKIIESKERVYTMALIHEMLYQSDNISKINFQKYIKSLSSNLYYIYKININRIQLKINIDETIAISIDKAIPCGLILNELLTNSLKYAFPDKLEGEISIEMNTIKPEQIQLIIKDNGVGIPTDLDWKSSGTLGMEIVKALTMQLQATMNVESNSGTRFILTFKE